MQMLIKHLTAKGLPTEVIQPGLKATRGRVNRPKDCFVDHAFHRDSVGRKARLSFSARLPSKSPQIASSVGFGSLAFLIKASVKA